MDSFASNEPEYTSHPNEHAQDMAWHAETSNSAIVLRSDDIAQPQQQHTNRVDQNTGVVHELSSYNIGNSDIVVASHHNSIQTMSANPQQQQTHGYLRNRLLADHVAMYRDLLDLAYEDSQKLLSDSDLRAYVENSADGITRFSVAQALQGAVAVIKRDRSASLHHPLRYEESEALLCGSGNMRGLQFFGTLQNTTAAHGNSGNARPRKRRSKKLELLDEDGLPLVSHEDSTTIKSPRKFRTKKKDTSPKIDFFGPDFLRLAISIHHLLLEKHDDALGRPSLNAYYASVISVLVYLKETNHPDFEQCFNDAASKIKINSNAQPVTIDWGASTSNQRNCSKYYTLQMGEMKPLRAKEIKFVPNARDIILNYGRNNENGVYELYENPPPYVAANTFTDEDADRQYGQEEEYFGEEEEEEGQNFSENIENNAIASSIQKQISSAVADAEPMQRLNTISAIGSNIETSFIDIEKLRSRIPSSSNPENVASLHSENVSAAHQDHEITATNAHSRKVVTRSDNGDDGGMQSPHKKKKSQTKKAEDKKEEESVEREPPVKKRKEKENDDDKSKDNLDTQNAKETKSTMSLQTTMSETATVSDEVRVKVIVQNGEEKRIFLKKGQVWFQDKVMTMEEKDEIIRQKRELKRAKLAAEKTLADQVSEEARVVESSMDVDDHVETPSSPQHNRSNRRSTQSTTRKTFGSTRTKQSKS